MDIIFIGHQSWLVQNGETAILVDPIFSHKPGEVNLEIIPPRHVNVDLLPKIDAICITHEHSDHLDLFSLCRLPKSIPIYVGVLMPEVVVQTLDSLGFTVHKIYCGETVTFQDLTVTFYAGEKTPYSWENRVYQLWFENASDPEDTFFIAVDTGLSQKVAGKLQNKVLNFPRTVAVTNNGQVSPYGVFGSCESTLVPQANNKEKNGCQGLALLETVINGFGPIGEKAQYILICGGGILKDLDFAFGTFHFADQSEMAAVVNQLSLSQNIWGPEPGSLFNTNTGQYTPKALSAISLDLQRLEALFKKQQIFLDERKELVPFPSTSNFQTADQKASALASVEKSLNAMAPFLLQSPAGRNGFALTEYQNQPLGHLRFVFYFKLDDAGSTSVAYALNIISTQFEMIENPDLNKLQSIIPFGVTCFLCDFVAVLEGRIHIWDLTGVSLTAWYVGNFEDSVIPFLYVYFGENTDPTIFSNYLKNKKDLLSPLESFS